MKKLIYLLILLFATSCTMQQKINKCNKWGVCKTDSVIETVTETIHDTLIKTSTSQAVIDMLFECDSLGNVYVSKINNLQSENSNLKMKLVNGHFVTYIEVPSDSIVIQWKEKEVIRKEYVTNQVVYKSKFMTFKTWWFWVTSILLILFILYWIWKILK